MTDQMPVGQTWPDSLMEAGVGVVTGTVLSVLIQRALFPILGIAVTAEDTIIIALAFSGLSLLRNLILRRIFNAMSLKAATDQTRETA